MHMFCEFVYFIVDPYEMYILSSLTYSIKTRVIKYSLWFIQIIL